MDYYCQNVNYFYYPPSLGYIYMGSNPIDQAYSYSCFGSAIENFREISPLEQTSSLINEINEQPFYLQSDSIQTQEKKEKHKKVISLKDSEPRNLQDQDFQIKFQSYKKGILYKKKNTESNIINQVISFINGDRSLPILEKLLESNQQKIKQYYRLANSIKKANKKYTNRKYLKKLLTFAQKSQFERVFIKCKITHWTISEVRKILNKLVFSFLRDESRLSILTSAKIYKETLPQHFWRKKQIENYLFLQKDQ